jgi:hypothetical protein
MVNAKGISKDRDFLAPGHQCSYMCQMNYTYGVANELSHTCAKFQFQIQKYSRLHKNDKRVDQGMQISNLQISTDFVFFV